MLLQDHIQDASCSDSQAFEEAVINAIFVLIPDLTNDRANLDQITMDDEPLNYLLLINVIDNIATTCDGCTAAELTTLLNAATIANTFLDCAAVRLKNYESGAEDLDLEYLLDNYFHTESKILAGKLGSIFNYLKWQTSKGYSYERVVDGTGDCTGGTIAYSWSNGWLKSIGLCSPSFFNQIPNEQANTLIHEFTHQFFQTDDIRYDWDIYFDDMTTEEAFNNADSYSEFAEALCQ